MPPQLHPVLGQRLRANLLSRPARCGGVFPPDVLRVPSGGNLLSGNLSPTGHPSPALRAPSALRGAGERAGGGVFGGFQGLPVVHCGLMDTHYFTQLIRFP